MDFRDHALPTPAGREAMVRAVVDGGMDCRVAPRSLSSRRADGHPGSAAAGVVRVAAPHPTLSPLRFAAQGEGVRGRRAPALHLHPAQALKIMCTPSAFAGTTMGSAAFEAGLHHCAVRQQPSRQRSIRPVPIIVSHHRGAVPWSVPIVDDAKAFPGSYGDTGCASRTRWPDRRADQFFNRE